MKKLNLRGLIKLICFLYDSFNEVPELIEVIEIADSINNNFNKHGVDYYRDDLKGNIYFFIDDFDYFEE